jgi:hypothetical protein
MHGRGNFLKRTELGVWRIRTNQNVKNYVFKTPALKLRGV